MFEFDLYVALRKQHLVRELTTIHQSSSFRPGRVFSADDRTETIYEDVVHSLIPWAWDGNVGTLFAYGQTGSGKTFTIRGLEHLVARTLFDGTLEGERNIHLAMFELAGNSAYGNSTVEIDSYLAGN